VKYINDKPEVKKERINMALDKALFDRLTERAAALKVSRSDLIRFYCENGLERGQELKPQKN
jgi:metal-responsive CopG/Arc/MetJ family transcriptional regulator